MFIDNRSSRGSLIFWACCDSVGLGMHDGSSTGRHLCKVGRLMVELCIILVLKRMNAYRRILGLLSNVKGTVNYWQETCIQSKWFMMIHSDVKIPRSNLIFLLGQIVKMSGSALNVLTFSVYFQSSQGMSRTCRLRPSSLAPGGTCREMNRPHNNEGRYSCLQNELCHEIYVQVQYCKITSLSLSLSPWCN